MNRTCMWHSSNTLPTITMVHGPAFHVNTINWQREPT